jgi:cyclic pyranopterin phosphate synthase
MDGLSHVDDEGRARMVDVNAKPDQLRVARASGYIRMARGTAALIAENSIKKGDVLAVAEIAGIQAAKRTFDLIPLCHAVHIGHVQVKARIEADGVRVTSEVSCVGKTGVEMEALTAVSVALLTVYDMCKAVDKGMVIGDIVLLEKVKTDIPKKKD